jgi:hypothetical protein
MYLWRFWFGGVWVCAVFSECECVVCLRVLNGRALQDQGVQADPPKAHVDSLEGNRAHHWVSAVAAGRQQRRPLLEPRLGAEPDDPALFGGRAAAEVEQDAGLAAAKWGGGCED